MVINENWEIKSDSEQIILIETRKYMAKKKDSEEFEEKKTEKQTWHGDVPQAFRWIIKHEINRTGLESLKHVSECIEELYKLVESVKVVTLEKVVVKNVISFAEVERIEEVEDEQ